MGSADSRDATPSSYFSLERLRLVIWLVLVLVVVVMAMMVVMVVLVVVMFVMVEVLVVIVMLRVVVVMLVLVMVVMLEDVCVLSLCLSDGLVGGSGANQSSAGDLAPSWAGLALPQPVSQAGPGNGRQETPLNWQPAFKLATPGTTSRPIKSRKFVI